MVNSCAVCDENKKGLSVFHFPKKLKRDWELEVLKVLKIKDLKIKDFVSTSSSVLCEIHFQEDDFKKQVIDGSEQNTTRKRLKSDAIPTMWPGFPMYLSKPKPKPRRTILFAGTAREEKVALSQSDEMEKTPDGFSSLDELESMVIDKDLPSGLSRLVQARQSLYLEIPNNSEPTVTYCLKVKASMEFEMWCYGKEVKPCEMPDIFGANQQQHVCF